MIFHDHLTRQLDIIPIECLDQKITVIGAGAIGSFTVLSLAKMGFHNISVIDFDDIEIENMNAQFYRFDDVGNPKVIALKRLVKDFTDIEINISYSKYENDVYSGIVISAVDKMDVRKNIWENHKNNFDTNLIIDPRMAAEEGLIFAMNPLSPKDHKAYELSLYTDDNAVQERCTAKSTMYTSLFLAGQICKIVKDYALSNGKKYTRITQWNIKDNIMECISNVA